MVTEYEIDELLVDAVRRIRIVESLRKLAGLIERGACCKGHVEISSDGDYDTRWLSPTVRQIRRYSMDRIAMDVEFINEGEWLIPSERGES